MGHVGISAMLSTVPNFQRQIKDANSVQAVIALSWWKATCWITGPTTKQFFC
jgi:hypothetical protein